jgi:hypothetical protein
MSENKKTPTPGSNKQTTTSPIPNNVIQLAAHKCLADDCKSRPTLAGFCDEHYAWFKEGLITKEGHKAKDFDKKYYAFSRRKKVA